MTEQPPLHQMLVLRFIAAADGVTAAQIGDRLYGLTNHARSRSASASQNAWQLIRKGLVERRLYRRELYRYYATEAGKRLAMPDTAGE